MRPVRIEDVAKKAGVSMKTVSRVLNREPNVREKTREAVMTAAAELNYSPNLSARRLAGSKSFLLGLLYGSLSASYLTRVQTGVLEACLERDYRMVLRPCPAEGEGLVAHIFEFLKQSNVDGIILTPPLSDSERLINALDEENVNYIRIASAQMGETTTVAINEKQAAHQMTEHLIKQGHKRIGFVKGPLDHGASLGRYEGFMEAMEDAGIAIGPELITEGNFLFDSGLKAAEQLLEQDNPPTAIFASNDDMAIGVMHYAHDKGIKIPSDLAVAGFDGTPMSEQIWPKLTTVHQPMKKIGGMSADLLIDQIEKKAKEEGESPSVFLDHSILLRESSDTVIA